MTVKPGDVSLSICDVRQTLSSGHHIDERAPLSKCSPDDRSFTRKQCSLDGLGMGTHTQKARQTRQLFVALFDTLFDPLSNVRLPNKFIACAV